MTSNRKDDFTPQTHSQMSENDRRAESDRQIGKLADSLRRTPTDNGRRNNLFLIGAGASVTAKIPAVRDVAKLLVLREFNDRSGGETHIKTLFLSLGDADAAYEKLVADQVIKARSTSESGSQTIDWASVYDDCFATICSDPQNIRELFSQLVEGADGAINWAHLVIGELAKKDYCHTVLTTNFDQLVLKGMVMAGVIPVVCDGLESLNRVQSKPKHPQLVELHGSRHSYTLRNRPEDVEELRRKPEVIGALRGLIQNAYNIVVVGYGAREPGFMDVFIDAAKSFPDKHIYWICHGDSPDTLSEKAISFCSTSRNKEIICGQDADAFFLKLAKAMGVGSPSVIRHPLEVMKRWVSDTRKAQISDPDIQGEVETGTRTIESLEIYQNEISSKASKQTNVETLRALRLSGKPDEALETLKGIETPKADILAEAAFSAYEKANTGRIEDQLDAMRALKHALDANEDPTVRTRLLQLMGLTGYEIGTKVEGEIGITNLKLAADACRERLNIEAREKAPLNWAEAQYNLANILYTLAQNLNTEAQIDDFKVAEDAYRQALKVYTRPDFPLYWAAVQNNLGALLNTLARKFKSEFGLTHLAEAERACRQALEILTLKETPLDWAATQGNLGNILSSQAENLTGEDSLARLAEAESAYTRALEVYTFTDFPLQWAIAQRNLGRIMHRFGQRLSGQDSLNCLAKAETAYRSALKVRTREAFPLQWAETQYDLGNVLNLMGQRLSGQDCLNRLVAAESAFRLSLEVRTRKNHPVDWAETQNNLGSVLRAQGERIQSEEGLARLAAAEDCYRQALGVRTREAFPDQWAITQFNLGNALFAIARRLNGQDRLNRLWEAERSYRSALEVLDRTDFADQWVATKNNLGAVLQMLGECLTGQDSLSRLAEAERAYRSVLEVRTRETSPFEWAMAQENIGYLCEIWFKKTGDKTHLYRGIDAVTEALKIYRSMQFVIHINKAAALLSQLHALAAN